MQPNDLFKLIGSTITFRVAECYTVLGNVACVRGVSLDGRKQTCARVADVERQP